jgi:quercetin dioxygenase-like cupin family protein
MPALGASPPEDPAARAVQDALNGAQRALQRCWEKGAADDYRLGGQVLLDVTVGARGHVKDVTVRSDEPRDAVLTACLVELARGFTLPAFSEGDSLELPLIFSAPAAQYTVRSEDAPRHLPKGGKIEARVLLDHDTAGADKASLSLLTVAGRTRIPLHRHTSTELIYVLQGSGRVGGLGGGKGIAVNPGDAIYVPADVAHEFESTGGTKKATQLVVLYTPAGPERRFKDPGTPHPGTEPVPRGETASQKARDPMVAKAVARPVYAIAGGKGSVKILFDRELAGEPHAYVGLLTAQPEMAVPEHVHAGEAELLYVRAGTGVMTVADQTVEIVPGMAVYIPPNTKHSFKVTSKEPVVAVQFYTPSGPEQRFKSVGKP